MGKYHLDADIVKNGAPLKLSIVDTKVLAIFLFIRLKLQLLYFLASFLIISGVNINPKDVVFTVKDKSWQVVWLENRNTTKGLEHIKKHTNDFVDKHNIQEKHLVSHLKNVIKKGVVVHSQEKILSNGKMGLKKIYLYKGKFYTLGVIGNNGYIVSMYPIDGGK